ncbi:MAG: hypothetical protein HQK67_05170 [Desulfamplus sp.]|nr:hypothetical protein [Desulfamplus sp.]
MGEAAVPWISFGSADDFAPRKEFVFAVEIIVSVAKTDVLPLKKKMVSSTNAKENIRTMK